MAEGPVQFSRYGALWVDVVQRLRSSETPARCRWGGGRSRKDWIRGWVCFSVHGEGTQALPFTELWDAACRARGTSLPSRLRAVAPAVVPVSSPEVLHVALGVRELGPLLPVTPPALPWAGHSHHGPS